MQGGLFGLSTPQKTYLFICEISPAVITALSLYYTADYLVVSILIQLFYILSSFIYIKHFSKEGEIAPYTMNEFRRMDFQIKKGLHLGTSAFLLITLYSILIIRLGRVHLPKHLEIGKLSSEYWYLYLPVIILNPILEEWFWRLFLPKVNPQFKIDHESYVRQNAGVKCDLPVVPLLPLHQPPRALEIYHVYWNVL